MSARWPAAEPDLLVYWVTEPVMAHIRCCPECGLGKTPQGLVYHRLHAHGVQSRLRDDAGIRPADLLRLIAIGAEP